jgi:general stress protein 26
LNSDRQRILAIMKENCLHAYLVTTNDNQPFVRPVSPILEDDMTIWVTTFSTSRKISHIRKNPKICLAFVEQPQEDKATFVFCEVHIVHDIEKKKRCGKWNASIFHDTPDGPGSGEFCFLKILPKRVEWRDSWEGGNKIFELA